ncbi:NADP oxidoreductase coenzyme F420-dependent [Fibrisoma limi BUZ 3]|uniref:NADP oxidoreductase coenzyme F420-dependent n=1 Tax=Fibrisoma limi BUZ 3 TaxID=1185876 RepID=I2GGE6_9BACT|nr:NAD(P)-binding domain-containing protein [Fibrisoma limi]CCH52971.1 NADP oxidoreductase coenzyme F420-dependent [Fibrisoma limi BUZ 3]
MSYTIGIIGSGNIGRGLATHLAKTQYKLLLTNRRGAESLTDLVVSIGGSLRAADLAETIHQADVLFLALPWSQLEGLAQAMAPYRGKILVDATNNVVSMSPFQLADIGGKTTGEYVADLFPHQRLVKAFNTLGAATLALPPQNDTGNRVIVLSGDDTEAKKVVADLAQSMGFAPIDLGTLAEGGKLQDMGNAFSGIELIKVSK